MQTPQFNDDRLPPRFWRKVVVNGETGCWEWRGTTSRGYGYFSSLGRSSPAHRHAYTVLVAAVPAHLDMDHLCRVRNCVNPGHLEPVTHRENVMRGAVPQAGSTHFKCGHPRTADNSYAYRSGCKQCRQCKSKQNLAGYYKNKTETGGRIVR